MMKIISKYIRRFSQDVPIVQKFIIYAGFLVSAPMLLISIIFFYRFNYIIHEEVGSSYKLVMSQYVKGIEDKLNTYQNLLDTIGSNGIVQDIFQRQDEYRGKDTVDMWRLFSNEIDNQVYAKNSKEIHSIVLYAKSQKFPRDGMHLSNYSQVKDQAWFSTVSEKMKPYYYFHYTTPALQTDLLSMVRNIPNLGAGNFTQELGLIRVELIAKEFFAMQSENNKVVAYDIYIVDDNNQLIYTNAENTLNEEALREVVHHSNQDVTLSGRYEGYTLARKEVDGTGWNVVMLFSNKELDEKVMDTGLYISIVLGLMLLLQVGMSFLFSLTFSKRTNRLVNKIKGIEDGDLHITEVVEGNDEIGMIDASFNQMMIRLNEQIKQNYIQRIETREAELMAMQFQINPHFLYNTLESISGMAAVYGVTDISNMSERLGMMFRYSINKSGSVLVSLKQEIEHIENYFYIQNVRFSDSFTAVMDIPDELMNCKIPKFILQPVVENTIIHGFDNQNKKGFIEILASSDAQCLYIDVYDDGKGIIADRVEELNSHINQLDNLYAEGTNRSIGIKNVNIRIKLIYGEEYGLQLSSGENMGTQVRIKLPLGGHLEG